MTEVLKKKVKVETEAVTSKMDLPTELLRQWSSPEIGALLTQIAEAFDGAWVMTEGGWVWLDSELSAERGALPKKLIGVRARYKMRDGKQRKWAAVVCSTAGQAEAAVKAATRAGADKVEVCEAEPVWTVRGS